ncbi:hypothetical protein NFI96_009031 [Prochilodus magdalenae]|nr:hypothetical protein NFI96_009031 [Prochilodus magdalenae]
MLTVNLKLTRARRSYDVQGKHDDAALQDTRLSDAFNEKMTLGLKEVEPPEQQDLTDTDIDPSMLIWKAVKQIRQQKYDKAEEDKDKLYHPPGAKLTAGNEQPYRNIQPQFHVRARLYQEPEQDVDHRYHAGPEKLVRVMLHNEKLVQIGAKDKGEAEEQSGRLTHLSPEEDKDGLYHGHIPSGSVLEAPVMQAFGNKPKMVYTEPEEDLDKFYHS